MNSAARSARDFFKGFAVAFSMYSRIPMPRLEWNEGSMRWALCWFPVVGAVVAAGEGGLFLLFRRLSLSPAFFAAAAVLLPVAVTGGIHLDGFCDTCDALAAHAGRETRLRILDDPHVGAFGVVYTCCALLLQFGAWCELCAKPAFLPPALAAPMLARALGGLAVLRFPKAKGSGLAAAFAHTDSRGPVTAALALFAAAAALLPAAGTPWALIGPAAAGAGYALFYRMAGRLFGGVTGDLAGFFIILCETGALALFALLGAVL